MSCRWSLERSASPISLSPLKVFDVLRLRHPKHGLEERLQLQCKMGQSPSQPAGAPVLGAPEGTAGSFGCQGALESHGTCH